MVTFKNANSDVLILNLFTCPMSFFVDKINPTLDQRLPDSTLCIHICKCITLHNNKLELFLLTLHSKKQKPTWFSLHYCMPSPSCIKTCIVDWIIRTLVNDDDRIEKGKTVEKHLRNEIPSDNLISWQIRVDWISLKYVRIISNLISSSISLSFI